ncbi:hypothetical protein LOK49_LG09G02693 [Camellia lanceoleosa]|uniref:Uncharacterized protein n=1 Tax=Camellia lanceoleosa TaxID=1840588 RepID=A0ACC0GH13_9ERIC|nr:hypothetical protein LOK49_LG09G02693 [Camellia lanceoleosa]
MMEESNRRLYLQFSLLILIGCFTSQLCASSDPIFYDSFDDSFEGSWIVSEKEDYKVREREEMKLCFWFLIPWKDTVSSVLVDQAPW